MKTLTLSPKTTTLFMRILAVIVMIYMILEILPLFDNSIEKGILFYYTLIIAIACFISAIGMWKLSRWSVILYAVATLALIPGFIYLNSWDGSTLFTLILVMIGAAANWRNLK